MGARSGSGARLRWAAALLILVATLGAPAVARWWASWRARVAVAGDSMAPTLRSGDWLLVDPMAYRGRTPRVGELVVAPDPRDRSRLLVKRVSAVDRAGRITLAGDNAAASTDPRAFGPIAAPAITGRPWFRYWPPARIGPVGGTPTP